MFEPKFVNSRTLFNVNQNEGHVIVPEVNKIKLSSLLEKSQCFEVSYYTKPTYQSYST